MTAKETLLEEMLVKMRAANDMETAVVELKQSLGTQFAEISNSDSMLYTDRETGEVKPWGISDTTMQREQARETAARARIAELLA